MLSAGAFLFSTGLSAADAGIEQQSGSAIIPLLVVGTGTVLLILASVLSGPLFEKKRPSDSHYSLPESTSLIFFVGLSVGIQSGLYTDECS